MLTERYQGNILVSDIDLSGTDHFVPFCTFKGVFDGGGYTINNLTVDQGSGYAGLFCRIEDAVIRNIGLENVEVKGGGRTGGLVGRSYESTIENSYTTGSVEGDSGITGGLIGENRTSTISNSYSTASVEGNCVRGR